jgi:hypothetical protein
MEYHNEDGYSSDTVELRDSLLHSILARRSSPAVGIPSRLLSSANGVGDRREALVIAL